MTYKGLKLLDLPQTNIALHFTDVTEFIDKALAGGGNVLVNCEMGTSCSSTSSLLDTQAKDDSRGGSC